MAQDQNQGAHPADGIIDAIKGLFDGSNVRQSLHDAYDRVTGQQQPAAPAPAPDTSWHDAMVKAANASFQKQPQGQSTSSTTPSATRTARARYGSLSKKRAMPPQK